VSITRIVSGAALVVILVGTVVFLPPWATVALAALAAVAAAIELAALARKIGAVVPGLLVAVSSATMTLIIGLSPTGTDDMWRGIDVPLDLVILSVTIAAGLVALALNPPGPPVFGAAGVMVLAPFYIGLPLGTMSWLVASHAPELLGWLIAVIAVSDSFQYFVGSAFGRRKLSPVVSPGKTIEGLVGGLVAAMAAGWLVGRWAMPGSPGWTLALLALVLSLFGVAGDLFESLLKRSVGAKDSGAIIPGHGGVLDRVDAYLFAAPAFYVAVRYLQL